jgi:hypothetical protein
MLNEYQYQLINVGEEGNFDSGVTALFKVCQSISSAKIIPIVFPIVSQFVSSEDWKFRFVGLQGLCQLGSLIPFSKVPFKQVLMFVKDRHPRVRHAALVCLEQMAIGEWINKCPNSIQK